MRTAGWWLLSLCLSAALVFVLLALQVQWVVQISFIYSVLMPKALQALGLAETHVFYVTLCGLYAAPTPFVRFLLWLWWEVSVVLAPGQSRILARP